jgi:hypothetical protein
VNSRIIWGIFVEKTRGRKSRATVPLNQAVCAGECVYFGKHALAQGGGLVKFRRFKQKLTLFQRLPLKARALTALGIP